METDIEFNLFWSVSQTFPMSQQTREFSGGGFEMRVQKPVTHRLHPYFTVYAVCGFLTGKLCIIFIMGKDETVEVRRVGV